MIAAAGTVEEGLAILLFVIAGGLVIWIIAAVQGPAQYNLHYKGGAPYCPNCNKQVSLRRDYCRSCGYVFLTHHPQSHQATKPLASQGPVDLFEMERRFIQAIVAKLSRLTSHGFQIFRFIIRLQWVSTLPEWAQPIVWGLIVPMPLIMIFLVFRAIVLRH